MKKTILLFLVTSLTLLGSACSSKDENLELVSNQNETDIILKIDPNFNIENIISSLDSLDSAPVPLVIDSINNPNGSFTRTDIISFQGTIENLGNNKVSFLANSGMNLVPSYLCGSGLMNTTISTVYRLTLIIDLGEDMGARGYIGEKSGWTADYLSNPQEQAQYVGASSVTQARFYTFCYHILTALDGWTLPNGGMFVPFPLDDIRLYAKIY